MKDNVLIRPATIDDVLRFYKEPFQQTIRAWAVEYEGEVVCIAGVTHINPRVLLAFSNIADGVSVPKITVWRTALHLFENIKSIGLPVIADPDGNIPGAQRFLERLGFEPTKEGLYRYDKNT